MTATASQEAVISSVFGAAGDNFVAEKSGTRNERSRQFKYWKRQNDGSPESGWVMCWPNVRTDPSEYQRGIQRGMTELSDSFGVELINMGDMTGSGGTRRLKPFLDNGGLTATDEKGEYLLPASQIVTYNWHRQPGIRELRPDLAEAVDIECRYKCFDTNTGGIRAFSGLTRAEAERKERQHSVVHKHAQESEAIGKAVGDAMVNMQPQAGGNLSAAEIAAIVASTIQSLGLGNPAPAPAPEPAPIEPEPEQRPVSERVALRDWCVANGVEPLPGSPLHHTVQAWRDHIAAHAGGANEEPV